jgi:biopolymer transport protein ExbD
MRGARKTVLVRPVAGPKSAINVTPLVDVVLVLLIIFMVVMPLVEKDLAVRIPATEEVETTSEVPPDQIVVRVESDGAFKINGELTPPELYVENLKRRLDPRHPADRVVFVTPEDEASYKNLVLALEGARLAGAETLGMTAEPPPPAAATNPNSPILPIAPGAPTAPTPPPAATPPP